MFFTASRCSASWMWWRCILCFLPMAQAILRWRRAGLTAFNKRQGQNFVARYPKSATFWTLVYGIPTEEVAALASHPAVCVPSAIADLASTEENSKAWHAEVVSPAARIYGAATSSGS